MIKRLAMVGVASIGLLSASGSAFGLMITDIDNANCGFTAGVPAGTLSSSTFVAQSEGADYDFTRRTQSIAAPNGGPRFDCTFAGSQITSSVRYNVYLRHTEGANRCRNVYYEVRRGAAIVLAGTVNQEIQGSRWINLGQASFSSASPPSLRLYGNNTNLAGENANCVTTIDAVRIAKHEFDSTDIENNSIGQIDIAANGVGASEIAANAVGASEIAAGAVGTSEIADNSVDSVDIENSTIVGADVASSGLNAADIADEAGLENGSSGSNFLNGAGIANCNSYTTLSSFSVTIPASNSTSYVFCSASGDIDFDTADAEVRVGIDGPDAGNTPDRQRLLGIEGVNLSSNDETDRKAWAVQNVYSVSSLGATQTYALVGCKDEVDAVDPGTLNWDPFVCIVVPTGR